MKTMQGKFVWLGLAACWRDGMVMRDEQLSGARSQKNFSFDFIKIKRKSWEFSLHGGLKDF